MRKIEISIIENRGYIFNAVDYINLRSKHRILGKLIGCVVSCPRNSTVNGMPAILSAYELCLLHEKNIVNLIRKIGLSVPPTQSQTREYHEFRERCVDDQKELLRLNTVEESRKVIDKIISGKLRKLAKTGNQSVQSLEPEAVLQEIHDKYAFSIDNALLQVPTKHPIDVAKTNVELDSSIKKSLKYRVFKDLWECGKYITAGNSFGGDFLVYPGDPMYYHASHIVHCFDETPTASITAIRLAACGRLSVLVNKLCVFAYLDVANDSIVYQTMEWQGNA